jgi:hypothetical protein
MRKLTIHIVLAAIAATVLSPAAPAMAKRPGPNGQILFLSDSVITTVNPDGSHPLGLITADCAHWSPSGNVIATCGAPDGSATRLVDPLTAGFTELFPPDLTLFLACTTWSPDGQRLACDQFNQPADPSRNGMYTIRASDGADIRRVTSNPGGGDHPGDYSPDGKQIVFERMDPTRPPRANIALFVVNIDGSGLRRITPWGLPDTDGEFGSWSPNGSWIVFGGRGRIHAVHPDGTDLHVIPLAGLSSLSFAFQPSWSPDGTKFVFGLFTRRGPGTQQEGIYTANADGTDVQQVSIAPPGSGEDSPDWGTHPPAG